MAIKKHGSATPQREMTIEEFKNWLKGFDKDGDGRISRAELKTAIRSLGARFTTFRSLFGLWTADSNGNGYIDDNEIERLVKFAKNSLGMQIAVK